MNLRQAKAADLKVEADIHCLATSGSRAQLMDRLAKHYVSVSHVNRKKWTTNECNVALKVEKKVGRKSKKSQRNLRNIQGKESGAAGGNFSYLYSLIFMSQ